VGTYSCSGLVPLFSFFSGVPDGKARKNMQVLSLLNCGCTGGSSRVTELQGKGGKEGASGHALLLREVSRAIGASVFLRERERDREGEEAGSGMYGASLQP